MKQVLIFLGLILSLLSGADASASVSHFLYTPLPLTPVSAASSEVKIAGIYWLPDYLKDNVSRDYNSNTSDDKGGGDKVKVCSDYGFISPSDLDLDVYTCSSYDTVPVHGLSCYNSCKCKPGFTYTSANCNTSAGYVLSGKSCEGKYQSCTCSKECCSDSMCRSNQSCVSGVCVNNDPCANVTCGTDETCSNGSCVSTCTYTLTASDCKKECKNPSSSSCTRSGSTYYASCGASTCTAAQTCSSGSCLDNCTNTITASYCASQCKDTGSSSCTRDGTTYYASCGASKCGSNQTCSSGSCIDNCTPLADETGCGIRGTKSCSNNCGGYRQCCKTAKEYCEENGYSSGISCQTGQTTETCSADSSYKKCTGSACPSSKTCTYGCQTYSSQSGCSNVCTVCYDDNCRNQTAITPPVNATCSSYYSDCSSKCQAWSCNSGYTKSGSSCVCAVTCTDKVTGKPANSHYVTEQCTACGTTKNINASWTCDSGYTQSGSSCVAESNACDEYLVSLNSGMVKASTADELKTYAAAGGKHIAVMTNITDTSGTLDIADGTHIYFINDNNGRNACSISTGGGYNGGNILKFSNVEINGAEVHGYGTIKVTGTANMYGLTAADAELDADTLTIYGSADIAQILARKAIADSATTQINFTGALDFKTLVVRSYAELDLNCSESCETFNVGSGDDSQKWDIVECTGGAGMSSYYSSVWNDVDSSQIIDPVLMCGESYLGVANGASVGRIFAWAATEGTAFGGTMATLSSTGDNYFYEIYADVPLQMYFSDGTVTLERGFAYGLSVTADNSDEVHNLYLNKASLNLNDGFICGKASGSIGWATLDPVDMNIVTTNSSGYTSTLNLCYRPSGDVNNGRHCNITWNDRTNYKCN